MIKVAMDTILYVRDRYRTRGHDPLAWNQKLTGKILNKKYYFFFFSFFLLWIVSCGRKTDNTSSGQDNKKEFSWHNDLQISDIPDFPVKGFLDGKEVKPAYINFERWRGSNDNVINFSSVKPAQQCGYMDSFIGFTLINKGNQINKGDWLKSKFEEGPISYQAYFYSGGKKSNSAWNCALFIESISNKTVSGKIALFFNDENKSWVAGKFEAIVCNN